MKLSTVLGTAPPYKPISIRPADVPSISISKKTVSVISASESPPKRLLNMPPIIGNSVVVVVLPTVAAWLLGTMGANAAAKERVDAKTRRELRSFMVMVMVDGFLFL